MVNFIKNPDNFRHNIILSYLAIAVVFIFDLFTPLGYAVWILYLIPLHMAPYRAMSKLLIYLFAAICSILIWVGFYLDAAGIPSHIAFFNRALMTIFFWVVAYSQGQKSHALNELALQKNQKRFERAETLAHVGSWVMNVTTGEMEISDELTRILGLDPDLKHIHISEYMKFVHPDDYKMLSEIASSHHSEGIPVDIEYRIIRSDGQLRYIHGISGSDDNGTDNNGTKKVSIRYGAAKDITERKTVEIALAQERELFESIFSSIPVMITIYDPNLQSFRFNEAVHNLLGYTLEDAEEGNFMEKVYPNPEERHEVSSFMQSLEQGWREFTLTAKDDTHVESSWSNIRLQNGTQIGIGIDLRQIKQAERFLRENQVKLLEAQRLAKIGSFTINFEENGKVEWSEEMFRIYERDISKGAPTIEEALDMIHPEDREHTEEVLHKTIEEKRKSEIDYRIIIPGNRVKYLHSIFNPIFDNSDKQIQLFGTSLDITERLKQQEIIKEAFQKLERSNKELEQFAYVASHDLQEPLRMVASYMKLLERKYKDQLDEKAKQYIYFAVDGSKRMSNLISDLLVYSRVTSQAKEFKKVELSKVYNDVLRDLRVLIKEKRANINSSKLPSLNADPIQMHQLLQNLIGNAIKFHADKTPEVNITAKEVENGWLFSIKDNGIGIDSESYERIFQIFQRLHEKDKYPGTGIGLALCKKIVENHGGKIWVESEVNKGTTFYFTLPERNILATPEERDNMEMLSA